MSMLLRRAGAAALVAGIVTAVLGLVPTGFTSTGVAPAPAAHAETYRYWSYWQASDGWTMSMKGSGNVRPDDGSVEGWRFIKSSGTASDSPKPRPEPAFDRICAETPAREEAKRVAVVIDYGAKQAAPEGAIPPVPRAACAQVPPDATGTEVLAAVTETSYLPDGRVCSIDGYPRNACGGSGSEGEQGDGNASPSTSPGTSGGKDARGDSTLAGEGAGGGGGLPLGAVVGVAVGGLLVGVLGGTAVLRARRSG